MLNWFDPLTAALSAVVLPIGYFLIRRLVKFLKEHASELLDAVFFAVGRVFRTALMRRVSLRRYCRTLLGKSGNRYLAVPGRTSVLLETDSVFVPLRFSKKMGSQNLMNEVLGKGLRVRIIGDPGSGKSSLVKKMFRQMLSQGLHGLPQHKLPIMLELKTFSPPDLAEDLLGKWAYGELRRAVAAVEGFEMEKLFDVYALGRGVVVLLDGLDEVAGDVYPRVATAILELSRLLENKSDGNSVVLTMRSQFHQQIGEHFDDGFPMVVQIQPFTPSGIYRFLGNWPFDDDPEAQVTRLYSELADRPTLREMCSNPLVLAMYVASDVEGRHDGGAPDTRTAFYSNVVEELLVRRRSRQLGSQARSMLREQRETILGRLARDNIADPAQPANSLSWSTAIEVVRDVLQASAEVAEVEFLRILNETGIISEERPRESFRFIHLTFCEFLAAREFAQGITGGWQALRDLQKAFAKSSQAQLRSRLVEVIPFCVASTHRSERTDALIGLAPFVDSETLGRCFLETQAYDLALWADYRASEEKALESTPSDQWDEDWLRRLHLFSVVLSDEAEWRVLFNREDDGHKDEFFATLIRSDKSRLSRVFVTFARTDAPAAFRLADAVGMDLVAERPGLIIASFDDPAFRSLAIQKFEALRPTENTKKLEQWSIVLAHAGMTSEFVADELADRDPTPLQARVNGSLDASSRWYFDGKPPSAETRSLWSARRILGPSMYSYALTLVITRRLPSPFGTKSEATGIDLLATLVPPGRLRRRWVSVSLAFLFLTAYLALYATVVLPLGKVSELVGMTIGGAFAVLLYAVLALVAASLKYPSARRFSYAILANVQPPWGDEPWRRVFRRIFLIRLPRLVLRRVKAVGVQLRRDTFVPPEVATAADDERRNTVRALLADNDG
ncbi:NACHT domain-containing protein [Amycolatopsis vancoresmycina]|uniref:NACHT domain-containing protein n=1 Tax=Amycolatopsis vancoresmycina TaxID=208444 RepID=UPI0012DD0D0F|nr:NACHT domain-containing protein [Amycolatopsis vancoresmycina]